MLDHSLTSQITASIKAIVDAAIAPLLHEIIKLKEEVHDLRLSNIELVQVMDHLLPNKGNPKNFNKADTSECPPSVCLPDVSSLLDNKYEPTIEPAKFPIFNNEGISHYPRTSNSTVPAPNKDVPKNKNILHSKGSSHSSSKSKINSLIIGTASKEISEDFQIFKGKKKTRLFNIHITRVNTDVTNEHICKYMEKSWNQSPEANVVNRRSR